MPIANALPSWRRSSGCPPCLRAARRTQGGCSAMAPGSPRRRGAWRPTWTGLSRGRSPPTCLSRSSCAPSSSSTSRRRRRLASRSRQRCSSGQTGSYNEGLSYQLDNRRDRAAEPPPAADALQPPLRCGFRARLRRSVSCTTPPEMDPGDFLRGRSLRREFRTGAKATGGLP